MLDAAGRGLRAFGRFWWDFLVGDTPELFLAVLALIGLAFALHRIRFVAVIALPLLAVAVLVLSTYRGRQRP